VIQQHRVIQRGNQLYAAVENKIYIFTESTSDWRIIFTAPAHVKFSSLMITLADSTGKTHLVASANTFKAWSADGETWLTEAQCICDSLILFNFGCQCNK